MPRKKRFVEKLLKSELETLEQGFKNGKSADFRQRCQILLISYRGFEVKQIVDALNINSQTVYSTLKAWNEQGLAGLIRKKGQGRKPILELDNPIHVKTVKEAVEKHAPDYHQVLKELYAKLNIEEMSLKSLTRFLKKLELTECKSEY